MSAGTMPALQDLLAAVDVGEKQVERLDPLHEAGLEPRPFASGR